MAGTAHAPGFRQAHDALVAGSSVTPHDVEVRGRRVHLIEAGTGRPILLFHGSFTSSLSNVPLVERISGARAIAVDRPGHGLSDPVAVPRARFRTAAVEFIADVLDVLGLDRATIAGDSMGGTWAVWFALAHPDRVEGLALLGSAPLLPGTRPPAPVWLMALPLIGDLATGLVKPDAKMVVRLLSAMGEGGTIGRHPLLIDALVAAARDPIAVRANLNEVRAIVRPLGFRRRMAIQPAELRGLAVPTLLVWGDHDPVGSAEVARQVAGMIPRSRLEILDAGHVPHLGHPQRVAELLAAFAGQEEAARSAGGPRPLRGP
jgi:pimeloyl-ACP methyl ester carboxylesterase